MLDTEGLQGAERNETGNVDEYDRKIVLFAMLAADMLIINNRGEISARMKELLQICTDGFDTIRQNSGKTPRIVYSFNQNAETQASAFQHQLQGMQDDVIMNSDSKTIKSNAGEILGFYPDRVHVLGVAF